MGEILAVFDFDKTLIRSDSFRMFAAEIAPSAAHRLFAFGCAVFARFGLMSNAEYKSTVLKRLWEGRSPSEKDRLLQSFVRKLGVLERRTVVERLKHHLGRNDDVVVMSASPGFYVEPFVRAWSEDVEVVASTFDGEHHLNMYAAEKRRAIQRLVASKQPREVWVYTDHHSDLPLIAAASHVRLVEPSRRLVKELRKRSIAFDVVQT